MISFDPLWKTMERKGATTYTLRTKGKRYNVGSSTIKRMRANDSVSTNALNALCQILDCEITDIIEYIPDED